MTRATILVVDDESALRSAYAEALRGAGNMVLEAGSGAEALSAFDDEGADLVLLDVHLPDLDGLEVLSKMRAQAPLVPVIMITGFGTIDSAVEALKQGAYDYLEKPIKLDRLLHCAGNALEASTLRSWVERRAREQESAFAVDRIVGESEAMQQVRELVRKVAASRADTVLVVGESGTGKELVARALHFESSRRAGPFMVLNCAAIPEKLLESELFGHEKGAFTGATHSRKGMFELADEGTLFLDEIAELEPGLQAKLLRVLEDRTFRRVGGVKNVQVDVRVVCASNRDLEVMTKEGSFRSDLYFRLSIIPIGLPPLRERIEDLPLLVDHLIAGFRRRFGKRIEGVTAPALEAMRFYPWPGNVRELSNVLERAVILHEGGWIEPADLPLRVTDFDAEAAAVGGIVGQVFPDRGVDLYQVERELIRRALHKSGGNKSEAARLLAISRDTLRYKVKKYGLQQTASKRPTS